MFITFGSHRKLDPGRRCPRQPHIEFKEGRSYAVTNPWWRRMPPRRNGGRNARGGASDANGAEGVTEAERRAQELGAAMLNAARPYIDVTLDRQGYPLAIQPRDFFTFMEAHAAFNNRTPNVTEKALVLEGMSIRVKDFCLSFKGLRNAMQDEDDVDEKPLLEYDPSWDPNFWKAYLSIRVPLTEIDPVIHRCRPALTSPLFRSWFDRRSGSGAVCAPPMQAPA